MTQLLERAFEQMKQLPEAEQDAIAALVLEEIQSEERSQAAFASSQDQLAVLGRDALAEYRWFRPSDLNSDTLNRHRGRQPGLTVQSKNMSRSTSQTWYRFRMGEAFPSDSVLARWIVGVASIANDLVQTHVRLLEGFEDKDPLPSPLRMSYFWLACAQFREAVKFLYEGELPEEISDFISTLPEESRNQWFRARNCCCPWEGSFVAVRLKPLRDKLFHYSKPGEKRWGDVLDQVAGIESGIDVAGVEQTRNIRFVFADEVRAVSLGVGLGDNQDEVARTMEQLSGLVGDVVDFAQEAVLTYLERSSAGIIRSELPQ